jgi:hypothetical protein
MMQNVMKPDHHPGWAGIEGVAAGVSGAGAAVPLWPGCSALRGHCGVLRSCNGLAGDHSSVTAAKAFCGSAHAKMLQLLDFR